MLFLLGCKSNTNFLSVQWADNNRNETLTRSLVGWRFEWQCQAGTFTIAIQMALIAMPSFHCNFYRFIATRIANNRFIEHHCIITGSNASFFSQWQAMMVIKQWRKPKQLRMRLRGRWFRWWWTSYRKTICDADLWT